MLVKIILITLLIFFPIQHIFAQNTQQLENNNIKYNGWDFLAHRLIADGVIPEEADAIFNSKNFPKFENVSFSIKVKESHAQYKAFLHPKRLQTALDCLNSYHNAFLNAEKRFSIDYHVVAAIMYVETLCGKNKGSANIVERLSRLANINDPNNIIENFKRLKKDKETKDVTEKEVQDRAEYISKMFYPELLALIKMARESNIDVLAIKGSYAGAFGYTQFLPSSFNNFKIDGNGDGIISLFTPEDAIASTANFLSSYGWRDDLSLEEKKQIIWNYNHSEAYVNTILEVANVLKKQ